MKIQRVRIGSIIENTLSLRLTKDELKIIDTNSFQEIQRFETIEQVISIYQLDVFDGEKNHDDSLSLGIDSSKKDLERLITWFKGITTR